MSSRASNILRLAIPSILANITIPLVSIVDVAIAGHIADATAIGGIAVGTMLFDLLYWNFGFLRVGTSGLTAQAYGRGDEAEQASILRRALRIALFSAAGILAIQWLFVEAALWFTPCSPEVADFAHKYFFIRVWAAPATLSLMACKGFFIGMQNTVAPMVTDIVVNGVNMAASYLLAVHTPLGALGVAYGTVIAQYSGLAVASGVLLIHYRKLWTTCGRPAGDPRDRTPFAKLNANLIVRSSCFMVIYVGYTALMAAYGDIELATATILMKLFMFVSFFIDGFAYAAEALVGKEGATQDGWQKTHQVKDTVTVLTLWMVGIGAAFSLLYVLYGEALVGLVGGNDAICDAMQPYYIYLYLMPIASAFAFLFDGVFIGATHGKAVRNCMVYAALAFVICYYALRGWNGPHAIYIGYMAHLIVRSIYLIITYLLIHETPHSAH